MVIDPALLDTEGYLTRDVPLGPRQLWPLSLVDDLFGAENLARLPDLLRDPVAGGR